MSDKQTLQVVPTTIVKASDVTYKHGRTMGITEGWLAYGLSKGEPDPFFACFVPLHVLTLQERFD
jgi:hypothetical protein